MLTKPLTDPVDPGFKSLYTIYRQSIDPREQKSEAQLAAMVSRPNYLFLVMQEDHRVVGFSISFVAPEDSFCLLEYMAVDEQYRRRGLGSELFDATVRAIYSERGVVPMLLEVDSDREGGVDQEVRRRRQTFYRRLGCRRVAGCAYILPLPGAQPPPAMDLLMYVREPMPAIRHAQLRRWIEVIYRDVYGCSVNDPRIAMMLDGVPDPVLLV
jgi:ribosomal protein S18 acetylase RimI-like enzyme